MTARLADIRDKVDAGERLSFDDGVYLDRHADLFTLGELANLVRERKNGNVAYYNVNDAPQPDQRLRLPLHLLRLPGRPEERRRATSCPTSRSSTAPREADEPRLHRAAHRRRAAPPAAVRVVSATSSASSTTRYPRAAPEGVHGGRVGLVRAADRPADAATCSPSSRTPAWAACPAAGRRSSTPRSATRSASTRPTPTQWLRIHREAHELGLRSNATMLYGHIEKPRAPHRPPDPAARAAGRDRRLPDVHPAGVPPGQHPARRTSPKPRGLMDLKVMAISRLMLDNFPHIKAYWVMLGIKTAQVALSYGADDIDGTVVHEKIYHDAGSDSPQELTRRRAAPADRGGRPRAGRARHAVPRSGPRSQAGRGGPGGSWLQLNESAARFPEGPAA